MKKVSLFFILVGILFSSLGSKVYIDDEINKEEKINTFVDTFLNISNDISVVAYRNKLVLSIEDSLSESLKKVDRSLLDSTLKVINEIEYSDIKELLIEKAKIVSDELTKKEEEILKYTAKETLVGNVSAFTAYCSDGCNGYTASGRYIGNNIYYNDKDYGKVRIVAGDKSYPFGTIVRFNNLNYYGEKVYAIVLDSGGAVGKNRKVLFDLLFSTEKNANDFGIQRKVSCDILRIGY